MRKLYGGKGRGFRFDLSNLRLTECVRAPAREVLCAYQLYCLVKGVVSANLCKPTVSQARVDPASQVCDILAV